MKKKFFDIETKKKIKYTAITVLITVIMMSGWLDKVFRAVFIPDNVITKENLEESLNKIETYKDYKTVTDSHVSLFSKQAEINKAQIERNNEIDERWKSQSKRWEDQMKFNGMVEGSLDFLKGKYGSRGGVGGSISITPNE